jgi:methyl-accepting chemotaxis protein
MRTSARPGPIKAVEARAMPLVARIIALRTSGDTDGARRLMLAEAKPAFIDWLAAVNAFIDLGKHEPGRVDQGATARGFQAFMLVLLAAAMVAARCWPC